MNVDLQTQKFSMQFAPYVQWEALLTGNPYYDKDIGPLWVEFFENLVHQHYVETDKKCEELWPKREYIARLFECYASAFLRGTQIKVYDNIYWEAIVSPFGGEE